GVGDRIGSGEFDILFMGGGQDGDQQFLEDDLFRVKADGLRGAVHDGVPVLAVCGSYQLLGHYYDPGTGPRLAGLGIFDMHTVHPGLSVRRCIGDVVVDWIGAPVGGPSSVVGFENHGGRTYIGSGARAFGRVVSGNGNNGEDGTEGVVQANAIGTYLHGSLLPKNPHLADHLIGMALARQTGSAKLEPLDDHLEWQAHQTILDRRAGHVAPVGGRVMGSGGSAR
ncbi:MAG: glutamine amidotransferase, partial [Chloroflexi bacterium]|nr:glutamine amidotransferase [Chloroflexota bacterium]